MEKLLNTTKNLPPSSGKKEKATFLETTELDKPSLKSAGDLQKLRKRAGTTQVQLAGTLGVSQKRISEIENTEMRTMRLGTIARYVEGLGGSLRLVIDMPKAGSAA